MDRVHPLLPEGCKFNLHFLIRRATLSVIQFVANDVCYQTSGHPFISIDVYCIVIFVYKWQQALIKILKNVDR